MKTARVIYPEESAMQSMCKQLFKSRLFQGYYGQRCYVDSLGDYRDVVVLKRNEGDLEKQLINIKEKLQTLYLRSIPNIWIGISKGAIGSYKHIGHRRVLDTCIWTQLNDLAFGEYWFSVKTFKFNSREVLLKLTAVRAVEIEVDKCMSIQRSPLEERNQFQPVPTEFDKKITPHSKIKLEDFNLLLQYWGDSIKRTVYNFMANDINKSNILSTLKFVGLLTVSIFCGAIYALRFLGIFTLRFMFELSRFTHVATPIILKLIEMFSKCMGGILIFFTIIWKDLFVGRSRARQQFPPALRYDSQSRSIN